MGLVLEEDSADMIRSRVHDLEELEVLVVGEARRDGDGEPAVEVHVAEELAGPGCSEVRRERRSRLLDGIQVLLDSLVKYFPPPTFKKEVEGIDPKTGNAKR